MLAALTLTLGYSLRAHVGPAAAARCAPVRGDADRCYYGRVDADGNVLKGSAEVDVGPSVRPSVSLSPSEVIEAQFRAFSRGRVAQNREGVSGIDSALEFVSPGIVEKYGIDQARYLQILSGPQFEGLLGCSEMQVLKCSETTDDKVVVNLRVMPKPVTGCVRMSGVADQVPLLPRAVTHARRHARTHAVTRPRLVAVWDHMVGALQLPPVTPAKRPAKGLLDGRADVRSAASGRRGLSGRHAADRAGGVTSRSQPAAGGRTSRWQFALVFR